MRAPSRGPSHVRLARGGGAALRLIVQAANVEQLSVIFGPDGERLPSTPPIRDGAPQPRGPSGGLHRRLATGRYRTRRQDAGHRQRGWPFPVPLVKDGDRWRFDTAAGKEEVLGRRIGRNELSVIRVCAPTSLRNALRGKGHDGKPAGLYAHDVQQRAGQGERAVLADRRGGSGARSATWWLRPPKKATSAGRQRGSRRRSTATTSRSSRRRDRPRRAARSPTSSTATCQLLPPSLHHF